jgi:hypothetical protein
MSAEREEEEVAGAALFLKSAKKKEGKRAKKKLPGLRLMFLQKSSMLMFSAAAFS